MGPATAVESPGNVSSEAVVAAVSPAVPVICPPPSAVAPPVEEVRGFSALVQAASPGVVNIYTTSQGATEAGRRLFNPFEDFDAYGVPAERLTQSLGTGFVISIDGYIVTNHHVIEGASRIKVRLFDERESVAEIIGTDPNTDIALIKIPMMPDLHPIALGDSGELQVGEWVVAIGNPFGLTHTVTAGIVSARGRTNVPLGGKISYMDFIQTDASINPGNSGGPLLNLRGEAIGISAAINAQGRGIGFAIPINMVRDILPQLMSSGRVVRSFIGIWPKPLPPEVAEAMGVPLGMGAMVDRVIPGGPAHQAGLRADDIVLRFDGHPIEQAKDLRWLAQTVGVGRTVSIEVLRNGEELRFTVVTEEMPE